MTNAFANEDEDGAPASDRPDGYVAAAEPGITTIGEEAERVTAARLMRRFKLFVTGFVVGFALIIFLPAFANVSSSVAVNLSLVCWNNLLLFLCLALAWTFRISENEHVYLQLGADGADVGALDTQIEMSGMAQGVVEAPVRVDASAPEPDDKFTID